MKVVNNCCTSCPHRSVCKFFDQMSNLDDTIRKIEGFPDYFNITIDCEHMKNPVVVPRNTGKHDKK